MGTELPLETKNVNKPKIKTFNRVKKYDMETNIEKTSCFNEMAENVNEEVSYDILEWFPIIYCQNVFKYLSGKDVIQASAVNKEWYKFTAESQQAAKYKLSFIERSPTTEEEEILKNSKRTYQNIVIDVLDVRLNEIFLLELLAGRAVCWKSVKIFFITFKEEETWTELLRIIEPTVEYLEIHGLDVEKESADDDVKLAFPRLKSLIFQSSPDEFNIYKYFHDCSTLSQFMWYPDEPTASPFMNNEILILLRNNPLLDDLDVYTADWAWLQHAHEFKFKLRNLKLSFWEPSAGLEPYLKAFLRIHAQTLELLDLAEMLDQAFLEFILAGMPRLTSFAAEIYELEEAIAEWKGEFPVNRTINTLNLILKIKDTELSALETLVRALKSLKHFKYFHMNDKVMSILAKEVPGLESIDAKDFNVRQFPEGVIFPNFKSFKAGKLRRDLYEPIGNGNFAVAVRKAMREYFGDVYDNSEPSFDILERFPIPYCQEVFKYLSGKDVLEASAVSRKWYKFTGESRQATKYKLAFKTVNVKNLNTEAMKILRRSHRRYQNIEFSGFSGKELHFFIKLLGDRAGDWKSVSLRHIHVNREATFIKIIQKIEPSVEEFTITKIRAKESSEDAVPDWSFPNLKSLECAQLPGEINLSKYFYGCQNLSKLKWNTISSSRANNPDTPLADKISTILYNNHDLKHLDLFDSDFMSFSHLTEIKFKLHKLRISSDRPILTQADLIAFLEAQALTLESLEIGVQLTQAFLELILTGMPRLTSFATEIYELEDAISDWEGEFPVNTTVTTLNFKLEVKDEELSALETLVRALPSLKHFKCFIMNDDMIFILADEVPGLESIDAKDFNVWQFPEGVIFPNFKSFKAGKLRKDLHEPIGNGNFAFVVRKAMREYFGDVSDSSEQSLDILERFPIPYCQNVFKYLSGKDVLEASAVSRKWYKFTGEGRQASKYKLAFTTINQKNLTTEAKEMLQDSNRRYQNIEFSGFSTDDMRVFAKLLGQRAGDWKSVSLRHIHVNREATFIKIIQMIEPSVEELAIIKIRANEPSENAVPDWSFPNLKSLIYTQLLEEFSLNKYFYGCQNLSKLKWHSPRLATNSGTPLADKISTILYNNHDLKHLDLFDSDFMSFSRLHEIKFKLRKLKISSDRLTRAQTDLLVFLEAQAPTLESLDIEVQLTQAFLELILTGMPRLTSYTMDVNEVGDAIFDWEGEYPVNKTITALYVHDKVEKARKRAPLEILIKAMPSLKNLKCKNLDDHLFNFLAREVPALESIETKEFTVSRFPDGNIFPNFKSFKGEFLCKDLQAPTGDGNFAVVLRKEIEMSATETLRRQEVSYDILEWFPTLFCQNVFKYLSGNDVRQASRVNKQWYKFTAESRQMAKLQLRFSSYNERYLTAEAKDMLKNSKRKYQNFLFDQGFSSEHSDFYFKLLGDRAGSLKAVTLISVYAYSDELDTLFGIIEPTVEELRMVKVNLSTYSRDRSESLDVESKWTFPHLKSLNCLRQEDCYDFYQHFYKCTNLSKVTWSTYTGIEPNMNLEIRPVLCNNVGLEELDLHDWSLLEHSSEFKFKLRKLVFTVNSQDTSVALAPLFYAFLGAQAQSLESLNTNVKLDQAFLQLILNDMPRLSSLTVKFDQLNEAISGWQQAFPVNNTIGTLNFNGDVADEHLTSYRTFMRALRSLRHFKFSRLTDEPFNIMAQELPTLESIEVSNFAILRLPSYEIFPNVKALKVVEFRDNFPEPIGDYEFAALVRREMRAYFPPKYFTAGPSYDILNWFPLRVCKNIFEYLDGKDVLQASAVSRQWKRFTDDSQQMRKVKLVFSRSNQHRLAKERVEFPPPFNYTNREYQNVDLEDISFEKLRFFLEWLALRKRSWKNVEFFSKAMSHQNSLPTVLRIMEPSVEVLRIVAMGLSKNQDAVDPKWTFIHLKSLQIHGVDNYDYNVYKYFVRCTSLVKFQCSSLREETPGKLDMLEVLRNNQNLKELDTRTDGTLFEHSPEFNFKLKNLRLTVRSTAVESLNSFLATHAPTLESLDIHADINQACLELILGSMPQLTSLTTHFKTAKVDWKQAFPMNTTITSYECQHDLQEQIPYENFVGSMQSLKHFKGRVVNDEVLLSLSQNVPNLETMEVGSLNISRFPEDNIFPNIKVFTVRAFPENLQEPTGDGNFEKMAKALMRKYFEVIVIDSDSD